MSKTNGAGKNAKNGDAPAEEPGAVVRKAPRNARVVKNSAKTGTISRAAARAAVKELMKDR